MQKDLDGLTSDENSAIEAYQGLSAAKTKEIEAHGAAIESKTGRHGKVGLEIVALKEDLDDTSKALLEDKKFLADLDKNCAINEKEWAIICKTRSEELLALADTIKMLNDDDALELFKKTLPGAAASFVEMKISNQNYRKRAFQLIQKAQATALISSPQLDFIALAIRGKKIGFGKVIKLIDDMVATLKQEQLDDDHKEE